MPISSISVWTRGLIVFPSASTPALTARHPGGAWALNIASDMMLRNEFSTHTNRTVGTTRGTPPRG